MADGLMRPISALHGVGPAREAAYARLGVATLYDLLRHYPRSYEDRAVSGSLFFADTESGRRAVILTVGTTPRAARIRRGMSLLKFRAFDETATCEITFFNQDYLKDKFPVGSTFRFYGKIERAGKGYRMTSPAYEPYVEGVPLKDFYPIYPLSAGLTQKQLGQNMADALRLCGSIEDPLPTPIRTARRLSTLSYALRSIHDPESYVALSAAKRRLIYDEFFLFALGLAVTRRHAKSAEAPRCQASLSLFFGKLPFALTDAQARVIGEIAADMAREEPMSRIVVGDVGCGKTVCAAAAIYLAVASGRQAALMAPTEILARQHYKDLAPLFASLGIGCELLVGATPAAAKRRIREALSAPDPAVRLSVVIGTHALLSDGVDFASPGLIVTDEQHRFGAGQRAELARKGRHSHVLVMSATPIPRSLALVLYGDLDISRIDQMPPGRQRVDTFVVDESYRARLDAFIQKQVTEGGQVYVVCPAVEEDEEDEGDLSMADISLSGEERRERPPLRAAVNYASELAEKLSHVRVGFVHGRMKSTEKDEIMHRFAAGEVDVLVSTTVIEVGVNVPNACLMIVENADRFGLSQLHQLRGRVGRGRRKSYCVLVSASDTEKARERLSIMRTTYDGYTIAEKDLAMRGPGDFLAGAGREEVRQSGGLRFRLADMCDDAELLTAAFEDARILAAEDRTLAAYPMLRDMVEAMFSPSVEVLN